MVHHPLPVVVHLFQVISHHLHRVLQALEIGLQLRPMVQNVGEDAGVDVQSLAHQLHVIPSLGEGTRDRDEVRRRWRHPKER